jgi:hypothetical protein
VSVPVVWPSPAITACARLTQRSQMYTPGPAIRCLASFWAVPQNEHHKELSGYGTRPPYLGRSTESAARGDVTGPSSHPANGLVSSDPPRVTAAPYGLSHVCRTTQRGTAPRA